MYAVVCKFGSCSVSVGQAIASRLGQQISKCTKKINTDLASYIFLCHCPTTLGTEATLTFDSVADPENVCYKDVWKPSLNGSSMSSDIKRQFVAAFHKKHRAEEEMQHVCNDVDSSLNFFFKKQEKLTSFIAELCSTQELDFQIAAGSEHLGLMSFLFHKVWSVEKEIASICSSFSKENPATKFVSLMFSQSCTKLGPGLADDDIALDMAKDLL